MKRMLLGVVIAVVFVAIVADEVRLHRVIQRQSGALERLTAEVGDLQRASVESEKKLRAARTVALTPNRANTPANSAPTILNVTPWNIPTEDPFLIKNPSLQKSPSKVPSNWEPFEFNGQTYYRVPLANASPEPLGFRP